MYNWDESSMNNFSGCHVKQSGESVNVTIFSPHLIKMATLQSTHVSMEFSFDGKLFAFISSEGKLKIWDTQSNQLSQDYTPNLHLSAPCTCFTWISIDTSPQTPTKSKKKARKSIDPNESSLYIAFGTNKGGVSLYSYATGKIEHNLKGNGHTGGVTAICRGTNGILYTCGNDGQIIVWNITNGGQIGSWQIGNDKPTCLLYLNETKSLLVGSRELKLWSTEKMELRQTYTGHTSNIALMKELKINDNWYVLSASKMDRTISLWRIKNGMKYKNAVATFLMADVAYFLNCKINQNQPNSDDSVQIAAVTRSGVVHVFVANDAISSGSIGKPIKPKVTIEVASDTDNNVIPIPIIAAQLDYNNDEQSLLLGYGDRLFLQFELIQYNKDERNQVLIRNDPKKGPTKNSSSNVNRDKILKNVTPIIDENNVEYQTPHTVTRKIKAVEIPMETRLENLSLNTDETKMGKNVVQLLIQGLHNRDSNVLRTVFATTEEKVIRLSLQRLPVQYVGALVNELTVLSQKKTANVQLAITWLNLLLQTHSSQLMALGANELFSRFGPLIGTIEHRAYTYEPLSKLNGRLDLLLSQIKRNDDDNEQIENANVLVYEDQDTPDNSDNEMNKNDVNSSDDQWEEEDSDEEDDENKKMDVSDNDDD